MKNLINYYYNLLIDKFKKTDDMYSFKINGEKYCFLPFRGSIDKLYRVYNVLKNNNRYCHQIILNKENQMFTVYENRMYILLKKNLDTHSLVTLGDINNYNINVYSDYKFDWKRLWEEKIDYYEYQMNQIGSKYKILRECFSYYIGLSEMAISLLNFVDPNNIKAYICHNRIYYKETMDSFLNPLDIIIDNKTRDIAEYFKINYMNEDINIIEIVNYLDKSNFDYNESILFLSRMLYPSYYFDIYDKIIQEKISEEKVTYYTKKSESYETLLKNIYKYFMKKYTLPDIEYFK